MGTREERYAQFFKRLDQLPSGGAGPRAPDENRPSAAGIGETSQRVHSSGGVKAEAPARQDVGSAGVRNSLTGAGAAAADPRADVVVITALGMPELRYALSAFGNEWVDTYVGGVLYKTTSYSVGGRDVRIAAVSCRLMGMVLAAISCCRAALSFRPKLVAMTGICAGVRGRVGLGDIVIAERVFDYGSGKVTGRGSEPDYADVPLDGVLVQLVRNCAEHNDLLSSIEQGWTTGNRPDVRLRAHVGVMASGSAVVQHPSIVQEVTAHQRKLVAIDMESYGVMRAADELRSLGVSGLVLKAVSDFADEEKSDSFQEYASYASAMFLRKLIDKHHGELFQP
jgi:nucleoside phosphorylase